MSNMEIEKTILKNQNNQNQQNEKTVELALHNFLWI